MSLMDSTSIPTFRTLLTAVNAMQKPLTFLRQLLGGTEVTLPTEDVEWSVFSRGRECAPFVKTNAEGVMTGGWTDAARVVRAPNIRIKRPFTPVHAFRRHPGSGVFVNGDAGTAMLEGIAQRRARDLKTLLDDITNTEEWMISQMLQGGISYSSDTGDAFTISPGRSSGNNIVPSVFLDDATPANVKFYVTIHTLKRLVADLPTGGVVLTDAVCGTEAAAALMNLVAGGYMPGFQTGNANNPLTMGEFTFASQFNDQGVIFLGRLGGVSFWEYGRSVTFNGASVPMVRAKYMEFFNRNNAACGREFHYAAIPDLDVSDTGLFMGQRLSKSWKVPDPSAEMVLMASRPLPVWQLPDTTVSYKAVSG